MLSITYFIINIKFHLWVHWGFNIRENIDAYLGYTIETSAGSLDYGILFPYSLLCFPFNINLIKITLIVLLEVRVVQSVCSLQ